MSQTSRTALVYNLTGQVLEFYVPELEVRLFGPPAAAATYSCWRGTDSNDGTTQFSGTATLDSVSTTVGTASGYSQANRRQLTLASTAGISVGLSYVLANALGQREIVTPYEITSATVIKVENDLAYDYAITTSTFKGLRHYFTIDATFIQTLGSINMYGALYYESPRQKVPSRGAAPPYRLRWSYTTADGIARQAWTYFDVARQKGKHNVTANDLRELFPDISDHEWLEQRGQQFAKQIDAAWDYFCFDLRAADYPVDQLREGPVVDELVRRAAIMIIAAAGIAPANRERETYVREAREEYRAMFNKAIGSSLKAWIDVGTTGAIHPDPPRVTRLRR